MNLGDGLLFELDNGKPRLILLSHGAERNPVKLPSRPRAESILSCRQEEQPARRQAGRRRETKSKTASSALISSTTTTKTQTNHTAESSARAAHKVSSDRPKHSTSVQSSRTNGKAGQLQNTVTRANGKAGVKDMLANGEAELKENMVCLTSEQLQQILDTVQTSVSSWHPLEDQKPQGDHRDANPDSSVSKAGGGTSQDKDNRLPGSLSSWLEEPRTDSRAALDAKKSQWRRELDEQVTLKQQQNLAPGSRLQEALSMERREEQRRRWLEELDRQREETSQRRRQEKILHSQTEDHERWAMHFDSLQRRPFVQAPALSVLPPAPSTLPPAPAGGLDRGGEWEAMSSCGGESVGRASVDTTTSHLRTMTALLDPAQIEERDRRRLKQLEHQRAIAAQVEERCARQERAEAIRREEEQQEERRLQLEREKLHRQYQLETLREMQKKEQQAQQMEQLVQSVQTAQQEALRSRQQQRITRLLSKGHDVSRLLHSVEPSVVKGAGQCLEELGEEEVRTSVPLHRHTAVQTETAVPPLDTADSVHSPEVSAEHQAPLPPPRPAPQSGMQRRALRAGKENVYVSEPGAADPYQAFARTERSSRDQRRPEWNTQRPCRRFVPSSERYPLVLQRSRQESRLKRQAELLALQERNCLSRTDLPPRLSPSALTRSRAAPIGKVESVPRGVSTAVSTERGHSPPLPAVTHALQGRQHLSSASLPPLPPPGLEFVPYVRSDEVFTLDPLEPLTTPPPHTHTEAPPPSSQRDPLLHPHTHRQQEILRGLAQIHQLLLQKQRELETGMDPLLKRH